MKPFDAHGGFPLTAKLLRITPDTCPCSTCGRNCKRRATGERHLIDIGLEGPVLLLITVGVYHCSPCRKSFRSPLAFAPPGGRYTYRARAKCIVSVDEDKMPFRLVVHRVLRDFHIHPALSTVHGWWGAAQQGYDQHPEYQEFVVSHFSGVLCVDGVHDGEFCVLLATDPLSDMLVGYEMASGETKEATEKLFNRLSAMGIEPIIVTTDGKKMYPEIISQLFKQAKHHRCLFHVMQDLVKAVGDLVLQYRRSLPEPPKRPRGRRRKDAEPTPANPATEIFHARYLFGTRPEHLSEAQQAILDALCEKHPRLRQLRDFMVDLFGLFTKPQFLFSRQERGTFYDSFVTLHADTPELVALFTKLLSREDFQKTTLFWEFENLNGTNNHVERTGRAFRKRQKSHYRLRVGTSLRAMLNHLLAHQSHAGRETVALKPRANSQSSSPPAPRQSLGTLSRRVGMPT